MAADTKTFITKEAEARFHSDECVQAGASFLRLMSLKLNPRKKGYSTYKTREIERLVENLLRHRMPSFVTNA